MLLDDRNLAYGNTDFLYRIEGAIISTAIDVQAEGTGVVNHILRSNLAFDVLNNSPGYAQKMAYGFTVNTSCSGQSSDTQLKTRASAIWNAYAFDGV